ncbi:hypothetical protein GQ54DRAFT_150388 [Martensiomyces pterosporus]|nr:hypothetical protein GQ54DRAFT_150388 [Martensiomyces pterosporus]
MCASALALQVISTTGKSSWGFKVEPELALRCAMTSASLGAAQQRHCQYCGCQELHPFGAIKNCWWTAEIPLLVFMPWKMPRVLVRLPIMSFQV